MVRSLRKAYPLYFFIDLCVIAFSFYLSYLLRHNTIDSILGGNIWTPNLRDYSFIFILWTVFIVVFFKRRSLYSTDRSLTIPKEISRVVISIFYTGVLMGTIIFFAQYKFFSRQIFITTFILLCVLLSGWRILKRAILRK